MNTYFQKKMKLCAFSYLLQLSFIFEDISIAYFNATHIYTLEKEILAETNVQCISYIFVNFQRIGPQYILVLEVVGEN